MPSKRTLLNWWALLVLVVGTLGPAATMSVLAQGGDGPVIDVWYGPTRNFGQLGTPQPWANVFGNVSDPDGVASLVYSLNGQPEVALSIGPDTRRLVSAGDFNADLATSDLVNGTNQVVITATDNLGNQTVATVAVEYSTRNVWPMPYTIDWSTAPSIQHVAQVVDGLWEIDESMVHTSIPGYDRLIAVGDAFWRDYEVEVPITIHSPNAGCVGILIGWNGHTDNPIAGWQPKSGYLPLGTIGWYCPGKLELYGNGTPPLASTPRTLSSNVPYIFRLQVETDAVLGPTYRLKVWEKDTTEPPAWDLVGQGQPSDPQSGSMMLLAHKSDASFGSVEVTPLTTDTTPPVLSNIQAAPGIKTATISWTTDELAASSVIYGPTAAYENGSIDDSTLLIDHSVALFDLEPGTTYHYQILSVDAAVNSTRTSDLTFTTIGGDAGAYYQDFEGYPVDSDPVDWRDTEENNGMGENNSLFKVYDVDGNKVFGTESTLTNIHSHYEGAGSDLWTGYRYVGRMMITDWSAGIGVTFFSQYPNNTDAYYRLRRYGGETSFRLSPHGTTTTGGTTDTYVAPVPGTWYWFLVEIEVTDAQVPRTEIRAKVWPEGSAPPAYWQIDAWDDSASRLTQGTVGVWSYSAGSKYWDDLAVEMLAPDAVTLASFEAAPQNHAILLEWETATEMENLGFHLYRSEDPGGELLPLTESLIPSQAPGTPIGAQYEYLDQAVQPGITYYYWLEEVDIHGTTTLHGPVSASARMYATYLPLVRR